MVLYEHSRGNYKHIVSAGGWEVEHVGLPIAFTVLSQKERSTSGHTGSYN